MGIVHHEATRKTLAILLEYQGTRYCGFQIQKGLPTIQGELERALKKLTGEGIRVTVASRTDAGVHARGQVASFGTTSDLEPETFRSGLNHYLPQDIAVRAVYGACPGFDARRHAQSREYRYTILNRPARSAVWREWAWHIGRPLDVAAMKRAISPLVGQRDFAPFAGALEPKTRSTVRELHQAEINQRDELIFIDMKANSFLTHQVRNTVGALAGVGLGKTSVESFWEMAQSPQRGVAGPTAPPHGLCLTRVNYEPRPEALCGQKRQTEL